jgi:hypothetical protein
MWPEYPIKRSKCIQGIEHIIHVGITSDKTLKRVFEAQNVWQQVADLDDEDLDPDTVDPGSTTIPTWRERNGVSPLVPNMRLKSVTKLSCL